MSATEHGTPPAHGTRARHTYDGCYCQGPGGCAEVHRRYQNRRARLIGYGQWEPYVDADPVRAHIRDLSQSGMGWKRTAEAAGVAPSTVCKLMFGSRGKPPSRRCRPETAAAILAVHLDPADGARVLAFGAQRRLQALVALGWSQSKLAARLGVLRSNSTALMTRTHLSAATVRAVHKLYDELWDQFPPEDTHRDKIAATRARKHAQKHRWAPPLAWDDDAIDDPNAQPEGVGFRRSRMHGVIEHGTEAGARAHQRAGETPCTECRGAATRAQADRRARKTA
jgi:transcriptional regulator with XRE-family HTH domain